MIGGSVAPGFEEVEREFDIDTEDVFRAMSGIFVMPNEPDWDERARRLLMLVSDGLRYGA